VTIGLDLDNTIVCYDESLHDLAVELFGMPDSVPCSKNKVRQYFRASERDREWTTLQGVAYGKRMHQARPFPGALDFLCSAGRAGHDLFIASHRTRYPVIGQPVDMHRLALNWLKSEGFVGEWLREERVFFEETREQKIRRITANQPDIFIDDLPEVLADEAFPKPTKAFLFAPSADDEQSAFEKITAWQELTRKLL
jgi:hypothetical protein